MEICNEPGLAFQVQFINKNYKSQELRYQGWVDIGLSWDQVGTKLGLSPENLKKILVFCVPGISIASLMKNFGFKNRTKFRNKFVIPMIQEGFITMTLPDKPNSPDQKYIITETGKELLNKISNK